jgi:hypothetical protein
MANRTPEIVTRDIAEVIDRLTSLGQDLATCPPHKRGTRWYSDRLTAVRTLTGQRDRLYRERRELILAN